jgi:anthranilate phosphoribosyltransferase
MDKNKLQFVAGIVIALAGAGVMAHGNIFGSSNTGVAIVIGIIGISLIAASKFRLLRA